MDLLAVRGDLLAWYDAHRRALPWRAAAGAHSDPYRVFVSEVMLQQTRVETVMRHFGPWMERFPDWGALAAAPDEHVMAQWAGLGYYRRARNLHAAARHIATHGLPQDAEGLRALPGVGSYMAGAVASIAFGQAVPAVDGNVVRVLSRLADVANRVDRVAGRRRVDAIAAALVVPDRPGDWNQGLMDLGATLCTPRPRCDACPVARHCAARLAGTIAVRPVAAPRTAPVEEAVHFALIEDRGRVLVVPRGPGLLAGTWMLPGGPRDAPLATLVAKQTGLDVAQCEPGRPARHVFTHRVWHLQVHPVTVAGIAPADRRENVALRPADDVDAPGATDGTPAAMGGAPGPPVGAPGAMGGAPGLARWVDPDAPEVGLSAACRKAIAAGRAPRP